MDEFIESTMKRNQNGVKFAYIRSKVDQFELLKIIIHPDDDVRKKQTILDYSILYKVKIMWNKTTKFDRVNQLISHMMSASVQEYFSYVDEKYLIVEPLNMQVEYSKQETTLPKLNSDASQAFIAYQIINFIRCYSPIGQPRSYLDCQSLREKLISHIATLHPARLCPIAKLKMISLFDFDLSADPDYSERRFPQTFSTKRFSNAKTKKNIVYSPTSVTSQLFSLIIDRFEAQKLCYGISGIGKSLSISLLVILCQMITNFRLKTAEGKVLEQFYSFIENKEDFKNIPHIFYVPVDQVIIDCEMQYLLEQVPQIIQKDERLKNVNFPNFIKELQICFDNNKIDILYVVDQIHIYYSLYRQVKQLRTRQQQVSKAQKLQKYYAILSPINQSQTVFYLTSINLEDALLLPYSLKYWCAKSLITRQAQHLSIRYEKKRESLSGFIQMANIVLFEIQKQARASYSMINCSYLTHKKEEFIGLFNLLSSQQYEGIQVAFGIQISHLRISHFFADKNSHLPINEIINNAQFRQVQKEQLSSNYSYTPVNKNRYKISPNIYNQFQKYFFKILDFSITHSIMVFKNFLIKGEKEMVNLKYNLIRKIKTRAQQLTNNSSHILVDYEIDQDDKATNFQFQGLIDKKCIFYDGVDTIFLQYRPATIIYITQQIEKDYDFLLKIYGGFLEIVETNQSLFGILYDHCCAKIISNFNVMIKLNNKTLAIKNQEKLFFQHFYEIQKVSNINKNFQQLFQIMEKGSLTQWQYYAASPRVKNPNFNRLNNQLSDNSRCIDCLLIRKDRDCYFLKTIDFSATLTPALLEQKYRKANSFFAHLNKQMQKENLSFKMQHYFVIYPTMKKCAERLHQSADEQRICSIYFESMISLEIEFCDQWDRGSTEGKLYKSILEQINRRMHMGF